MTKYKPYWSWQPWMRWFCPLILLVWLSKRNFQSHVWYQDETTQLELRGRFDNEYDLKLKSGSVKSYPKRNKV